MPLTLKVLTPEKTLFEASVSTVVAPATKGLMGILVGHAPLVTTLDTGELSAKLVDGTDAAFMVSGGFLEVAGDVVTVLADTGEAADAIDEKRARESEKRARERLYSMRRDAQVDLARAEAALARAAARLRIAGRYKMRATRS
jgi:F-type H+-transporting ATPase subunit epsilon